MNGTPIQADASPIILDDRTLVPLRVISEALGCQVNFDNSTNNAIITKAGLITAQETVQTVSGSYKGYPEAGIVLNGKILKTDVPPIVINGRIMVPVRLVAESLGLEVDFDNNTVLLKSTGSAKGKDDSKMPQSQQPPDITQNTNFLNDAASALGITTDELKSKLQSVTTLDQILGARRGQVVLM